MYNNIVLAYDGSQASQQALLSCKDLSHWQGAKVHLLAAVPYALVSIGPETAICDEAQYRLEEENLRKTLEQGVAQLTSTGIEAIGHLCKGDPVDQIVQYAQTVSADLIMLGHKHRSHWIERWWRGSISKALIELAPCSVLVVILK